MRSAIIGALALFLFVDGPEPLAALENYAFRGKIPLHVRFPCRKNDKSI